MFLNFYITTLIEQFFTHSIDKRFYHNMKVILQSFLYPCLVAFGFFLSSFNYAEKWSEIDNDTYLQTTEETYSKIAKIETIAKEEGNIPEQIYCIIRRNALKNHHNTKESVFNSCINELKQLHQETNDKVARSIITYIIGKYYLNYYQQNAYNINRRTNLGDYVPENIDEWTSQLFINKIHECWFSAIANENLKSTPSIQYSTLLTVGEDSRTYRPTLYDLLVNDMTSLQYISIDSILSTTEKEKLLQDLVDFHANDKESDAYVKAKLLLLRHIFNEKKEKEPIIQQLKLLLEETKGQPSSILVRSALCKVLKHNVSTPYQPKDSALLQQLNDICVEGVRAFPQHNKINDLTCELEQLNTPEIWLLMDKETFHSSDSVKLTIRYANINHINLNLYRLDVSSSYKYQKKGDYYNLSARKSKICSYSYNLSKSNYTILQDTIIKLPPLEYGIYRITFDKGIMNYTDFTISDIFYITHQLESNDMINFFVVDSKSGEPKPNVKVESFPSRTKKITDKNGLASISSIYDQSDNYFYDKQDVFIRPSICYSSHHYSQKKDNSGLYAAMFTDRSIYRPSQTIHFKCILYMLREENSTVDAKEKVTVTLYDPNYTELESKELETNDFGSINTTFVIPKQGPTGDYFIRIEKTNSDFNEKIELNYLFFKVEEYKRPTFEVKLTPPTESFSFNDTIRIKGHADYLLGTPLTNAHVKYIVKRQPCSWWCYLFGQAKSNTTIAEGTTTLQMDGSFDFSFLAERNSQDKTPAYYQYSIYAKVTDINGETNDSKINLSVGDQSLFFHTDLQKHLLMEEFYTQPYKVMNLNGDGQVATISYEVLHDERLICTGNVTSDSTGSFTINEDTRNWISGAYTLKLKTIDEKGREVSHSYKMVLYRKHEKCPPVFTTFWHDVSDVYLPYGKYHKVRVGSSLKNANLLVVRTNMHGQEEIEWIKLNNEFKNIYFELKEKDGDRLYVNFFLVNEGVCEKASFTIKKEKENKVIPVHLSVFRNKMAPGSKETWTLTLPKEKQSEVLAAMYDASLDKFTSHKWIFRPEYNHFGLSHNFYTYRNYTTPSIHDKTRPSKHEADWNFDKFRNLFEINGSPYYSSILNESNLKATVEVSVEAALAGRVSGVQITSSSGQPGASSSIRIRGTATLTGTSSPDDDSYENSEEDRSDNRSIKQEEMTTPRTKVRTNFTETAFFYPQLRTDPEGNVQFSFEMPESLTRWNFMALAHTKDLFYGQFSDQMVTQKDFMISPNLPRFLRKGDRCVLSAKIINLSDTTIKGSAILELLDPITEKVLITERTNYSVEKAKNGIVTWQINVPRDMETVLVRTSAVANKFSDAEQSLLPILSDRMVVTQSMPIYVRSGQSKDYTFEALANNQSNTLNSRFLKLEFAKNPIWYAIQAIPSIVTVEYENTISYSAAHFAALMSQHIANSNPKIFNVINTWKKQGMDEKTLLSNLEKNQEVKNVLLNESPWVMEAKNETEMKQRLSALFAVDELQNVCDLLFDQLKKARLRNGGYTWFKSEYPSLHTTLFVLDNLGRLRKAGIINDKLLDEAKYESSLHYLDDELYDTYKDLKKDFPNDLEKYAYVNMGILYYFQVHSLFPEVRVSNKAKEAYTFYYNLAKKNWKSFSLYGKALAAIAFYRNGDTELARTIVKHLRSFSTTTDEMGMFWMKNTGGYLWSDAAISTHTRIMEALEVVDPKVNEQDELRLWLLNQKHTQDWDNPIANVDALNVLLLSGSDWISNDNHVTIKLGDKTIQPEKEEVGTGYFTKYFKGNEVKPDMGHVKLKSETGGNLSWGALYWQFEEEIDKIKKSKTDLHVGKMVMLEVQENGKPVLKQIGEGTKLSVGDKLVVRLTLRTNRDMDYVSLKDQRASCLEPVHPLSGYRCSEGTCYYQSPKDAAMYYFFDHLSKGTYVFEYPLWVTLAGDYCNGITTAQCLYAPEFQTNTESVRIQVKEKKD